MKRTYKYRLYPNRSQKETLGETLETCRRVYNTALTQRNWRYQETGKGITYNRQSAELKEAKEGDEELSRVHSQVLQDVLRRVAILHEKVANRRKDYLHKVSRVITDDYDLVLVEDLRIKNMLKNHHLAKAIADASWGTFFQMLAYKAEEAGGLVEKVDPKGTSQACSNPDCLARVPKTLATRIHKCPYCGLKIDRDENAAITIRRAGTARIACGESGDLAVAGSAGVTGSARQEAPSFREGWFTY